MNVATMITESTRALALEELRSVLNEQQARAVAATLEAVAAEAAETASAALRKDFAALMEQALSLFKTHSQTVKALSDASSNWKVVAASGSTEARRIADETLAIVDAIERRITRLERKSTT